MAEILEFDKMFYKNFEPKTGNRFIMEINGIESYMIKTAARPTVQFEVITMEHINVKRKLKGKGEWQDVTITLYDPIVPSGAQQVMEWIRTSHESITGRDGYNTFYKKDITFYLLGPVGDKVEQWTLKGAFISQANFGELDWASNDPLSIELTLTYDYAILEY
jgi:hypothetical protein